MDLMNLLWLDNDQIYFRNKFFLKLFKAKIKLAAAYPYQKNCTKTNYLASSLAMASYI